MTSGTGRGTNDGGEMADDSGGLLDLITDIRNLLLLAILLGQLGVGAALWLTRDAEVDALQANQSKILRILRQDFREQCVDNGNPVNQCEKRLRSDDRYWPSTSVLYRTNTTPPVDFMFALYGIDHGD